MKKNILNLFGLGKTKFSASTASLVAVKIYLLIEFFMIQQTIIHLSVFISVFILSLISFNKNRSFALSDAKEIVVDEFLGMYICLILAGTKNFYIVFILFVLFRILDIFKFPPFSIIDKKIKGAVGVLADDIAIGIVIGLGYYFLKNFTTFPLPA